MYWLDRYLDLVTLTYIVHSGDFDTFYIDVRYLIKYKTYNHKTLHSVLPHCPGLAGTLTQWPWPIFDTFYVAVW